MSAGADDRPRKWIYPWQYELRIFSLGWLGAMVLVFFLSYSGPAGDGLSLGQFFQESLPGIFWGIAAGSGVFVGFMGWARIVMLWEN